LADEALRAQIEAGLQHRSARPFAHDLEAQYQARRGPGRRARLARALRLCVLLIPLALIFDWLNRPSLLAQAIPIRLVLTALCAGAALLMPRLRHPWQEAIAFGVPVLAMVVLTEMLAEFGAPRMADRYVMGAMVVAAALIVTQPLAFAGAAWICIIAMALFPLPLWLIHGPLPLADNPDIPALMLGVMAVCMLLAHRAEIARRLAFLNAMRHELTAVDLQLLNAELLRLSSTDVLTGLANRRQFEFDLARHWSDRKRGDLAVALIDVDYFKSFNDSAGHAAGDACLRRVAGAIAGAMRHGLDQAARYGGEEFAVLLPGALPSDLHVLGERLRAAVEALNMPHPGQQNRPVTISVGVAWRAGTLRQGEPDTLLREADRALYAAKEAGRNRVAVADGVRLAAAG
jgi:diguanylate cyclase (GGDEF)-like protein